MDRCALVTGASKGIGRALLNELVSRGWTVVAVARSQDKLEELRELHNGRVFPLVCDVSKSEEVSRVSESLRQQGMEPSLFFLNAAVAGEAACESTEFFSLKKHEELFATNYFGVLSWVEEWFPRCEEKAVTFVVTSSVNAYFAPPTGSAYAASKAAVAKAFEGLSISYPLSKASFSVVYAGPVATEGLKGKLPFTWKVDRMAKYMVTQVLKGKTHIENSLFWSALARLLRILPNSLVLKILGRS